MLTMASLMYLHCRLEWICVCAKFLVSKEMSWEKWKWMKKKKKDRRCSIERWTWECNKCKEAHNGIQVLDHNISSHFIQKQNRQTCACRSRIEEINNAILFHSLTTLKHDGVHWSVYCCVWFSIECDFQPGKWKSPKKARMEEKKKIDDFSFGFLFGSSLLSLPSLT